MSDLKINMNTKMNKNKNANINMNMNYENVKEDLDAIPSFEYNRHETKFSQTSKLNMNNTINKESIQSRNILNDDNLSLFISDDGFKTNSNRENGGTPLSSQSKKNSFRFLD